MPTYYLSAHRSGKTIAMAACLAWAKRKDSHARQATSEELTHPVWWWIESLAGRCVNAKGQTAFAAWQASDLRDLPFAAVRCWLFD